MAALSANTPLRNILPATVLQRSLVSALIQIMTQKLQTEYNKLFLLYIMFSNYFEEHIFYCQTLDLARIIRLGHRPELN